MIVIHPRQWYIGTNTERSSVTPPSDAIGAVFYETDTSSAYMWSGAVWVSLGGASGLTGSFNAGEVAFALSTTVLDGSAQLKWDDSNKELHIGDDPPTTGITGIQILKETSAPSLFTWFFGSGTAFQFVSWAARGSKASPSQLLSGDVISRFRGRGYHSGPGWSLSKAVIQMETSEDWTAGAQGSAIEIQTTKTTTTTTIPRLRVDDEVKLGDVDAGNYMRIDDSGQMALIGNARTHQEIRLEASQSQNGASAPTSAFRQVGTSATMLMPVKQFSKVTQQDVHFIFHYTMDMDFTEPVHFHLMWIPGASYTTGNYVWKLEYVTRNEVTGVVNAGGSTTISVDVTPANAYTFIESEFTDDITLNDDEILICHLYRDVASDNADDVGSLLFVEINYIKATHGEPI